MTPEQKLPVVEKLDTIIDLLTRRVPIKRGEWQPIVWFMSGPWTYMFRLTVDAAGLELELDTHDGRPRIPLGRWLFEE